jgi:hypothetical protein
VKPIRGGACRVLALTSLCREQGKPTMCESEVQIGDPCKQVVRLLSVVGALAIGFLPMSPGVRAQWASNLASRVFAPANDVSFTISTERSNYGHREQIAVKYRIVNISNGPLYVPRGDETKACLDPDGPSLHILAWFENNAGKHSIHGYGFSCAHGSEAPPTLTERMNKVAALLHPGERFDGAVRLDPTMSDGLPPGPYRIEATLYGWSSDKFTDAEWVELEKMGSPFMSGEVPASLRITLTPQSFEFPQAAT